MNLEDRDAMQAIRSIEPHRITKLGGARMAMKVGRNPLTGQLYSYFDPLFVSGIERQGYDATPILQEMEATLRESGDWRE